MAFTGTTAQEFIDFVTDAVVDLTSSSGLNLPADGAGLNPVIESAFPDDQAVLRAVAKDFLYTAHDRLGNEINFTRLIGDKAEGGDSWNAEKQAQLDAILTPQTLHDVIKHAISNGGRKKIGFGSRRNNPEYNPSRDEIYSAASSADEYLDDLERGRSISLLDNLYYSTAIEQDIGLFSATSTSPTVIALRERYSNIQEAQEAAEAQAAIEADATAAFDAEEARLNAISTPRGLSPLDLDGDGRVDALTDGMLYMRYLFGLRGKALADSAIASEATRSVEEIEEYIKYAEDNKDSALFTALDVNGDGTLDALTDSLYVMRKTFGLTGDSLSDSTMTEGSISPEEAEANIDKFLVGKDAYDPDSFKDFYGPEAQYEEAQEPSGEQGPTGPQEPEEPVVIDSDGDGVPDEEDAFPNNSSESVDTDDDGVGDNTDFRPNDETLQTERQYLDTFDRDDDGTPDDLDFYPDDPLYYDELGGTALRENRNYALENAVDDAITFLDTFDRANKTVFSTQITRQFPTQRADEQGNVEPHEENIQTRALIEAIRSSDAYVQGGYRGRNSTISDEDRATFVNLVQSVDDPAFEPYKLSLPPITNQDPDSDGDGVVDSADAFPNDPEESTDFDGDGYGDNSDALPENAAEWLDTDSDGTGDNSDAFKNDPAEWEDTDSDGYGNNSDAFPSDASEWLDTDGDEVGDNTDFRPEDPEIGTERDYLDTFDRDEDGTADDLDVAPDDPIYQTQVQVDEQDAMGKFLNNNSRALIGSHAVIKYQELTEDFDFNRPYMKDFLEWREKQVNRNGTMPSAENIRDWMEDKGIMTPRVIGGGASRRTVYDYTDDGKHINNLVALEGRFFKDHVVSERETRLDAVTNWQTTDVLAEDYFQYLLAEEFEPQKGFEGTGSIIKEYAIGRNDRRKQLNMLFDALETAWNSAGSFFKGTTLDMRHMELAWGPVYQEGGDLAIGAREMSAEQFAEYGDDQFPDGPPMIWEGAFEYAPEERVTGSTLGYGNHATRRDWQNIGLGKFINDFVEEYGEDEFVAFATEYKDLINDPLDLASGINDVTHSSGPDGIEHNWANGTDGPILKFLDEDYKKEQQESWQGGYDEYFAQDENKQKVVDQYTRALPELYDAIDEGTTRHDLERLINLGASKRLGDLWRENNDEDAFFAALEGYNVEAFIEMPRPLRGIEGTPRGYDADRLYMKMPGDDNIVLRGNGNYKTSRVLPMNNADIRAKFANGDDIPWGVGYHEDDNVGYFVDISGGEAEVGDYTMVWVRLPKEPNDLEKGLSELGPITDIIQAVLSIVGGPPGRALAMKIEAVQVGLKVLATGKLELEDLTSLILYGMMELGELVLPVDEAAATAAGEAARPAAEAAAAADGLLKGTDAFAKFVDAKVAAEVNLALTGIGVAGLSANQTIAVMRAAGSGNLEDMIFPVLNELGGDWIQNGLKGLGVSDSAISSLSQTQLDAMYGVVGKMAGGESFEQAVTGELLSLFDDTFNISGQAKGFFEDFKSDFANIARVAEEFLDNEALSNLSEFIVGGLEDLDLDEYLEQLTTVFDGSIESIESVFDTLDIAIDFTKDIVQPVESAINQMVAPLVANAKIQYDKLPDGVQAKIENLTNDLDKFVGGPFTNLEPAVKEAVKQGMVQRLLGVDGDSLEGEAAIRNAFTREFITVETIAGIDNTVVDILSPGAIATALRAGLNTILAGQPDANEAMVRAFAQYVKRGIERSIDAGTFAQDFQSWWDTAGTAFDNFEAEEAKVEDVQARGVAAGTELRNAEDAKAALEKTLDEARTAANAADATDAEKEAFIAMIDNNSTYRDDLVAANARITAANDAIAKIEAEEVTVLEGYNTARDELSLSNQLKEPTAEAYNRVLNTSMAQAIDENYNDHVYAQLYDIPDGMTATEYFLSVGSMEGHATTADEYNDRMNTGSSEFAMNTLRSAGIDVTKMTDEERQGVTNYLTGTWAKDKAAELGITELEYIEQFNKEFDSDVGSAEEAAVFITEAMGTPPEEVAEVMMSRRADRAFDILGTSYAEMGDILNNDVSYTFDSDTGKIVWGGDGFMKREWDDASGKFVTYQYDMGGAMRYQLNEDGSTPVVPTYEEMPMFRGIDSLAEDDPQAYMTVIATAPPALSELSLLRKTIFEEIAADPDYVVSEDFQLRFDELTEKVNSATEDSDYAIPNQDITYFQRIARDSTKKAQDAITAAEIEVFELGKIPNRNPEQEAQLTDAVERLRDAEDSLDSIANWAIRLPANVAMGVNTMVRGIGTALADSFVNAPLYDNIRANAILGVVDPDNENIKSNQELQDEWYDDPDNWISREFDYSTVVNNDFNTNMLGVESIGYAALPELYRDDVTEFWTDIETAEGIGGKLEALYNGFKDKPDVFLTEVVGMELGQELVGLFGGLGIAKITTKAAMLRHSDEVARALGEKAGFATNVAIELGDSFGQVAIGSYNEAYAELKRIGYSDADAEAKAAEIAMTNAGMSVLLMSAVPGARALDNKVLSAAGNRALNTFAERLVDGAGVVGKEFLNEIFQELGTGIHFESALYSAGVEDRDYEGNIAVNTALAAIVSPMVTTSIYGLSIPATGVDGSSNNPITGELMKAPKVQELVLAGDSAGLNQYMSDLGFTNDNIIFVDVMDTVDDANYVTTEEARDVYEYYGVEPAGDDLLAISGQGTESTAILEAEAYWTARYGENTFGTGRTNAQHYDIIQHITDMIDGRVPLDPRFNYDGNMTLSEADLQRYMDNMSGYERDQLATYDAGILDGSITHEPSGIIEEMGGSLMTTEELQKLQADIATLIDRPIAPTPQEVVDMLLQDPANKALFTGAITAAVENEFTKLANKEAFAKEVVNQLLTNETVKTGSESAIKSVLGDPDADEAEGIFKIMEDLETQIGLGDTDPVSLTQLIKDKVGSTGTFVDGVYQNDGKGLLGDLTAQGVGRDVAIAQINSILGQSEVKEDDATDANPARPATGLYAIAQDINSMESVFNTINTDYSTVLPNLALNVGMAADDPNNESGVASGLYAKVAEAIKLGGENKGLIEGLLGEYATFEDFKVALDGVLQTRVDETAALFGNPAQFQYDNEGNIELDAETGEPLFVEGGEPTGYHAEIYNAMRMQGEDRDNALAALEIKIDAALVNVETVSSEATAEAIKTGILDVYFPPKPEDYTVGRDVAKNLDYIQSMMTTGQVDPAYDVAGEIGVITAEDYEAYVDGLDGAQVTALDNYNGWLATPNAISPMLENVSRTTDAKFDLLDRRVDSVQTGVTDYIRNNVLNVIGVPANDVAGTGASGIFLAIEEGNTNITDVLGELGTIEDGVLTGGKGILKDMQLLGMDTTAINDYLTNTLGKPAEGDNPATGIFAAVDANQNTLESIEGWFNTFVDTVFATTDGLAREGDLLTETEIKTAIETQLGSILTGTELTSADDISAAVEAVVGEDGLNLAVAGDKLKEGQIKSAIEGKLGEILTATELVTQSDIAAAVTAVIGEGVGGLNLAVAGDKLKENEIKSAISGQLDNILTATELTSADDISAAVEAVVGEDGLNLAVAGDKLKEGQIKSAIEGKLGEILTATELVTQSDIAAAVTAVIGEGVGGLNLAVAGDKLKENEIKSAISGQLDNILTATELTSADDISAAVEAVVGEDGLNLAVAGDKLKEGQIKSAIEGKLGEILTATELVTQSDIAAAVTAVIGEGVGGLNLAVAGDKLKENEIKSAISGQLDNILTATELTSADDISAAVEAVVGEDGLNLAVAGDKLKEGQIKSAIEGKLGEILTATELVTQSDIAAAVTAVIGEGVGGLNLAVAGDKLKENEIKSAISGQLDNILTATELTSADDISAAVEAVVGEDGLNLAVAGDKLKEGQIKSAIEGKLGEILTATELVTQSDIAAAVTAVIGEGVGGLNLAVAGDKLKENEIKSAISGQLDNILTATELTSADDISAAVEAVVGEDGLNLAVAGDKLKEGQIKSAIEGKLGEILTATELVTQSDIAAAVTAVIGEGVGGLNLAVAGDKLKENEIKSAISGQLDNILTATELTSADDISAAVEAVVGEDGLNLAVAGDKLKEGQIKSAIEGKLGEILTATELVTQSDIAAAVTAVIGEGVGGLNLAVAGDKLKENEIKSAISGQLDNILTATELTSADDISAAVEAVVGEDGLNLAVAGDRLKEGQIKSAIEGKLGEILTATELVTQSDIAAAVTAVIGEGVGGLNLAVAGDKLKENEIKSAISTQLVESGILTGDDLVSAADITAAVKAVVGADGLDLAVATDVLSDPNIQKAIREQLEGVALTSGQTLQASDIATAVNAVIGEDGLGLATTDDVLTPEELAAAVQTEELKNVATVDSLLDAGDISGAVNAAIGEDGLDLATKGDVLDPDEVAAAVTTQLGDMIASGETVSAATIQDAIANQTVAIGQVVSAEQAGLATSEQLTEATQDLATSDDIQMLADLIGKPVNLLTQEDYILATNYLDSIQQDIDVAEADALRYDVTGDQQLTQQDLDLMQGTLDTGDYSQFADTSQFRDTATGMLGREQQLEAELAARDLQIEADRQAQIERDQDVRTQMQADMQEQLIEQQKREEAEEMFMALNQPGRTRTTKASPLAEIGSIYDFDDIFRDDKQRGFYGSASPYGDNFLDEILNPQQRASGGMVKDKTDEILKIIGDK